MTMHGKKSFAAPDEVMEIPRAKLELVRLGDTEVYRWIFEPGWRYGESMKQVDGTEICPAPHAIVAISGRMAVRMEDGDTDEFGPGDIGVIPAGHNAWVVGDEPFVAVDFQDSDIYEKLSG